MGKKKRDLPRGRRSEPDDYFSFGPFELARFGKCVLSRNNFNEQGWQEYQGRLAAQLPEVTDKINNLVREIVEVVSQVPPLDVLRRAWYEAANAAIRSHETKSLGTDEGFVFRAVEYIQSVIAASLPSEHRLALSEEVWANLSKKIIALFHSLSFEYPMCRTAHARLSSSEAKSSDSMDFQLAAELHWLGVRGCRYQVHQREALITLLEPQSDEIFRLFGLTARSLADELEKISMKLIRGLGDAFHGLDSLREEAVEAFSEPLDDPLQALRDFFEARPELAERKDRVLGEIFGFDLFNVEKVTTLSPAFLRELSWAQGEDREFLAPGDLMGWPLRAWPTMKRPFIWLEGQAYCFDEQVLFDRAYRIVEKTVMRCNPRYREEWNRRQKIISEELAFKYLSRLLPGAKVIRSVYYRVQTENGQREWCECDGIVTFDDHLFIVEAKAGAFSPASPTTDFESHRASLKQLAQRPVEQGLRFLTYIRSAEQVDIFDEDHRVIGRLQESEWRCINVCAVTVDQFTEFAARGRHLEPVGVRIGEEASWILSIDDLRVYADLFENPVSFLHFVENRMRAARSRRFYLDDELDHLGLYLAMNDYSQLDEEVTRLNLSHSSFAGFRDVVDDYFGGLLREETPERPKQRLPGRLEEVIAFLGTSSVAGRARVGALILDMNSAAREKLAAAIEEQLKTNLSLGRLRPFSMHGSLPLTLIVWSPPLARSREVSLRHTRSVLAMELQDPVRFLVELEYSSLGKLVGVKHEVVSLKGLSNRELEQAHADAAKLKRKRLNAARNGRGVGRNELCPCGSGRKYKRCCLGF